MDYYYNRIKTFPIFNNNKDKLCEEELMKL